MKQILLLRPTVIAGVLVDPSDDLIALENEAADALIAIGHAQEADTLDAMKLDELRETAAAEGVSLERATRKAEIASAIRAHRLGQPVQP